MTLKELKDQIEKAEKSGCDMQNKVYLYVDGLVPAIRFGGDKEKFWLESL